MVAVSLALFIFSGIASAKIGDALIGYGIPMYKPNCAFACRSSLGSAMLVCTDMDMTGGGHSHGAMPTAPECYAGDTPWLTTLAYCISSTCADSVEPWVLEKYWAEKCTGDASVQPKWTYQETLVELNKTAAPTQELDPEDENEILSFTALYNQEMWESYRGTLWAFERAETMHSRYAITLLVVGFAAPIFLSVIGYLPYMTGIIDKIKPRFVYAPLIGTFHVRPLPFSLGNAPTTGQAFYIAIFTILNVILTSVGYRSYQPSQYYETRWQEIIGYVAARTGVLSFALAPLVILFAGRNNILLWLTNWSHSTYMLLHRWVARVFTLHVILHSILELMLYQNNGGLAMEQVSPYWIWGIVATIACCIMVVCSTLFFRRLSYEIFLIIHIVLAVFVIAGSWYHIEIRFERAWGYQNWIYAACAVWFFDRLLRVGRVLKNGLRRAEVVKVADDIVRIDIKGLKWEAQPGRHIYTYFPTLNPWRPWENHPFSVIPTALLQSRGHSLVSSASSHGSQHSADIEKTGTKTTISSPVRGGSVSGISLYIRKSTGLTRALTNHKSLLTLLDGPYPNNNPSSVLKTDRLILIAGGIGITGSLPFIAHHQNVKLFWSVKQSAQGLVDDMEGVLRSVREKELIVGRTDLEVVLKREEDTGWGRIGVVVCGPGSMCDDVRNIVARRGREGKAVWELDVEAFSW